MSNRPDLGFPPGTEERITHGKAYRAVNGNFRSTAKKPRYSALQDRFPQTVFEKRPLSALAESGPSSLPIMRPASYRRISTAGPAARKVPKPAPRFQVPVPIPVRLPPIADSVLPQAPRSPAPASADNLPAVLRFARLRSFAARIPRRRFPSSQRAVPSVCGQPLQPCR